MHVYKSETEMDIPSMSSSGTAEPGCKCMKFVTKDEKLVVQSITCIATTSGTTRPGDNENIQRENRRFQVRAQWEIVRMTTREGPIIILYTVGAMIGTFACETMRGSLYLATALEGNDADYW